MIPSWTMAGVVPPIQPNLRGDEYDRSPYTVNLIDIVEKFVLSDDRAKIINGFLQYRAALHSKGIKNGFQWVDGSFFENIEATEGRPPNDIDVVTFFYLPPGQTQVTMLKSVGGLFDPKQTKQKFKVDGYPCILNQKMSESSVRQTAYWYSMWSHRRDGLWKGFAQVDLNPAADGPSRTLLAQKVAGGFGT